MFLRDKQLYALHNTKKNASRDAMWRSVTQCGGLGRNVELSATQCGGLGRNLEVYRNTNF